MKIFVLFSCFFCLIIFDLKGQYLPWISFTWEGDSIGNHYHETVAMTVPVEIEGIEYDFVAQFDLGAVTTMFYGNTIEAFFNQDSNWYKKIDTTSFVRIQGEKQPIIRGVNLKLDQVSFPSVNVALFRGYGEKMDINTADTKSEHIGSIAPDLLKDKVLIIDYPKQRLCLVDSVPDDLLQHVDFVDFIINDGRIKLPFSIDGKKEYLLFDTGASLFTLFTTSRNIDQVSGYQTTILDSLEISSWGEYYFVYGKEQKNDVKLGAKSMPKTKAYYTKREDFAAFFDEEGIWGVTGNAYFLNNVILIDYKNKKFGIK